MSNLITIDQAAHRATEALRASNDLTLRTYGQEPPKVSSACISDLATMHRFTRSDVPGKVDAGEIDEIFARTRLLDGVGLSVLRVSIGPLKLSGPCDMSRPRGRVSATGGTGGGTSPMSQSFPTRRLGLGSQGCGP